MRGDTKHTISFSDDSELRMKELYLHYYKERDKQMTNFWEHSKYVWGIILGCFTGYGFFLKDFLEVLGKSGALNYNNYNIVLFGISFLGIITSFILYWMARGCKAWFEVFESVIWYIESYINYFNFPGYFKINNFQKIKDSESNHYKFTGLSAGPYSPSKVNILIPYTLIIIWSALLIFHFFNFFYECNMGQNKSIAILLMFVMIVIVIVFYIIFNKLTKSSSLHDGNRGRQEDNKAIVSMGNDKIVANLKDNLIKKIFADYFPNEAKDDSKIDRITEIMYFKLSELIEKENIKDIDAFINDSKSFVKKTEYSYKVVVGSDGNVYVEPLETTEESNNTQ